MKYKRTPHAPWSLGRSSDDIGLTDADVIRNFEGKDVMATEKLDGEITCFSRNEIHARSLDSGYNAPWQTYFRNRWESLRWDMPEDVFLFGENMYGVHSIEYTSLPDVLFVFMAVKGPLVLSWTETRELCNELKLSVVPELKSESIRFPHNSLIVPKIPDQSVFGGPCEGYVIRNANKFLFSDFNHNVMKCVRAGHVQTDEHWTKTWKRANINDRRRKDRKTQKYGAGEVPGLCSDGQDQSRI